MCVGDTQTRALRDQDSTPDGVMRLMSETTRWSFETKQHRKVQIHVSKNPIKHTADRKDSPRLKNRRYMKTFSSQTTVPNNHTPSRLKDLVVLHYPSLVLRVQQQNGRQRSILVWNQNSLSTLRSGLKPSRTSCGD